MTGPDTMRSLLKVLDAEYAAVYAYGVVAARLTGRRRAAATAGYDAHRARRDRLRALVAARGGTSSDSGPIYRLPFAPATADDCVRLAALVEERVTAAYLELVAVDDAALRRMAALAMQESTTRACTWRPEVPPFPGWPAKNTPAGNTTAPTPASSGSPTPGQATPTGN
jgi:hypothetical protein